jgi:hypothetical protein
MRGVAGEPGAGPDVGAVRLREIPPRLLGIPESGTAPPRRGVGAPGGSAVVGSEADARGIAALFAAHSWERAPEMKLPRGGSARNRRDHGLCTYTVARALMRYGGGLTFAELDEHVRTAYAALPWGDATPLAWGDLTMRVVPGHTGDAEALPLRHEGGRLVLDAGSLRGLTVGARLEVYLPGRFADPEALLGEVVVQEVGPLRSICGSVADGPDPAGLPDGVSALEDAPRRPYTPSKMAPSAANRSHRRSCGADRSPMVDVASGTSSTQAYPARRSATIAGAAPRAGLASSEAWPAFSRSARTPSRFRNTAARKPESPMPLTAFT